MVRTLYVVLFFLLSGCAATKIPDADDRQIKSVAIVSLVPDTIRVAKIGLTVFNNERAQVDLRGKLTNTVIDTTTKRLIAARPNWKIKTVSYDRPSLIKKMTSSRMVMVSQEENIEKELASIAQSNAVDALVVVSAIQLDTIAGDGVGIYFKTMSLSSIQLALVHANIGLTFVNPQGKIIAQGFGMRQEPKPISPEKFGIKYDLQATISDGFAERVTPEVVGQVENAINKRFDQLGIK